MVAHRGVPRLASVAIVVRYNTIAPLRAVLFVYVSVVALALEAIPAVLAAVAQITRRARRILATLGLAGTIEQAKLSVIGGSQWS